MYKAISPGPTAVKSQDGERFDSDVIRIFSALASAGSGLFPFER